MKQIIFDNERDYINTHFLKRISYLMMYFGYTRSEVAKKANIARSTFYRYLSEGTAPTENALYKLASAFNSDWDIFAKNEFLIQEFNPETKTFNIKHCKYCCICKYWYDPTNSAITPVAPNINMWGVATDMYNDRKKCLKTNLPKSAVHSCSRFECKLPVL